MPPLNEAHLETQSPIALKQPPSDGDNGNGSAANSARGLNVETQPLIKALTDAVMAAIAEKYTLVPRK
jgi:hypothetical protein